MDSFDTLCSILDTLLGPNGCPWDQKQTLLSLREHLLEETHEVIEAITEDASPETIAEELGDLIGMAVFVAKVAEKEGFFHVKDACKAIADKLVRRHPHIFQEKKDLTADEVLEQWEVLKNKEKKEKKHFYDRIPKGMPGLQVAQEVVRKISNTPDCSEPTSADEVVGKALYALVQEAESKGVNAEFALRSYVEKVIRTTRNSQ